MIKIIVFDWGGVFTGQNKYSTFLHRMCKKYNVYNFEEIKMKSHLLWEDAKIGRVSSDLYFSDMGDLFGIDGEEFEKKLIKYYKYNYELIDIVKDLKLKGYKIGVLTNNIKKWFEYSLEEVGLVCFFDYVFTSYDYHLAKPQKEIYVKVLSDLGVDSSEVLFVDDLDRNLHPAIELGFKTHLFVGNSEFLAYLKSFE